MADRIFIQKSRIGLKIFHLKADALEICSHWTGKGETSRIELRTISPEYRRVARRFTALIVVPLVLCVLCLLAALVVMIHGKDFQGLSIGPLMFSGTFLVLTIQGVPRVDSFQFFDCWGRPVFYVVREKNQSQECDDFVRELLDHIERIDSAEQMAAEDETYPVSAVQLPSSNDVGYLFSGDYRWKLSIAAGAFSAGVPWVGAVLDLFEELPFPLVFFGTVVGLGYCVLSYQAKERLRHFSLLGAAFALIAPLFY
ncbi:MAG: hypothetical protein IPP19_06855 [Verrucomicrobia bacterium]|nr:hypothetical protein [Verrucomicrobiota bacterium]